MSEATSFRGIFHVVSPSSLFEMRRIYAPSIITKMHYIQLRVKRSPVRQV